MSKKNEQLRGALGICVGSCDGVVYRQVRKGRETNKDEERAGAARSQREAAAETGVSQAGWLAGVLFQAEHFSVCTDLAAASTAAAAPTMGSFTYK